MDTRCFSLHDGTSYPCFVSWQSFTDCEITLRRTASWLRHAADPVPSLRLLGSQSRFPMSVVITLLGCCIFTSFAAFVRLAEELLALVPFRLPRALSHTALTPCLLKAWSPNLLAKAPGGIRTLAFHAYTSSMSRRHGCSAAITSEAMPSLRLSRTVATISPQTMRYCWVNTMP